MQLSAIRRHPCTRAHQIPIAVHVVHAADGGPELGGAGPLVGERGRFSRVRMRPLGGADGGGGVRGVLERVVELVALAAGDGGHFAVDGNERVAKTIQLRFRFALGGLDHERAGNGERHRGRVITVIHQALRDVFDFDAAFFPSAEFQDAFVGDEAAAAFVEHREIIFEALGDVVGVENREFGGAFQAVGSHHADVHPRDDENAGAAPRGGGDGADGMGLERGHWRLCTGARGDDGMAGQKRHELRGDADRAHAGTAAAVRNAESFVEIEMADVGADMTGRSEPDLRVHVGAVHINLAAVAVDCGANIFDGSFENTVRGRVGDHQGGEIGGVFFRFRLKIGDVDVAIRIAGDGDDLVAAHRGARGIGAVGAGRDEANVAMTFVARFVVRADDEEAGVFALRAGVGLERDGGEPGDFGEPLLKILKEARVTFRLFGGCEGMHPAEFGPRDGQHFTRGVELHRARTEGDHRVAERQVLRFESADVAEHFVLGVVAVEDGRGQIRRGARERLGVIRIHQTAIAQFGGLPETGEQSLHVFDGGGFVEGNSDRVGIDGTQVEALGGGVGEYAIGGDVADGECVEDRFGVHRDASGLEAIGE